MSGSTSAPRAVVVTVGDELLHGETVDSNAAWLGRRLSALGFEVAARFTVGDREADIRTALERGLAEGSLVLFTGGLGPTHDDLTRPVVADALGAPLVLDADILEALRERFLRRGFEKLPESNVGQAMVPRGGEVLANPRGTAPGLLLDGPGGAVVALLPGVPAEMRGIFDEQLTDRLKARFGDDLRPVRHRTVHTTGISESDLADRLAGALPDDDGPVGLAFLPDVTGVDLRLTVRGVHDVEEAEAHLDEAEAAVADVVEPFRYVADESGDLVEPVSRALARRGFLLAAAESCTGGLLSKRMTDRPGASEVFAGGVVAYSNGVKRDVLGVAADTLEREGAVSEAVAREMAQGAATLLGCACGVGITGVAGPGGGTAEKPVGLVWYAATVEGRTVARRYLFPGDRDGVRQRSTQAALALLMELLRETEADAEPVAMENARAVENGEDADGAEAGPEDPGGGGESDGDTGTGA